MTTLTLDWIKEAPKSLHRGMVIDTGETMQLIGDMIPVGLKIERWAWLVKPYQLDCLMHMAQLKK